MINQVEKLEDVREVRFSIKVMICVFRNNGKLFAVILILNFMI